MKRRLMIILVVITVSMYISAAVTTDKNYKEPVVFKISTNLTAEDGFLVAEEWLSERLRESDDRIVLCRPETKTVTAKLHNRIGFRDIPTTEFNLKIRSKNNEIVMIFKNSSLLSGYSVEATERHKSIIASYMKDSNDLEKFIDNRHKE